ncbi:TPA: LysR family transcriptional regulator [Bacillus thuringiensis]|uniref:LysR family transcriptional regulator n=1 Tax=Bacillus TaxID=1386 RepID=UPI000BFCA68E|nr:MULTISPECIES: LysR family transcriptional regulator [Bacillus cereus group]PGT54346.1 LysR family transcriptional regulator [Bacillus thuringiensis]HDR7706314.1 LysR family transcriptional regulator [Bacillus thuringiensis]HEF1903478.1 LysR family transcriptional regulator [Bacillus cereus]
MNFEQMEYIVAVANTGSFTKAALQSHVTLSAISQSISLLENELGVKLFARSRGLGAVPTSEGKSIIKKASDILLQVKELKEEAQIYNHTLNGELRIATIPGPMHVLINIISTFKKEHPYVNIKVYEKDHKKILEDLQKGEIDIGFIASSEKFRERHNNFTFKKIIDVKIVVGVNKNSPLALEKILVPEQLVNQALVLYDDEYIRGSINKLFSKYGNVDILFISNNTQAIENAVKQELAITIGLDYSFKHNLLNNQKEMVSIVLDVPNLEPLSYGWVLSNDKQPSNILVRFINKLQFE